MSLPGKPARAYASSTTNIIETHIPEPTKLVLLRSTCTRGNPGDKVCSYSKEALRSDISLRFGRAISLVGGSLRRARQPTQERIRGALAYWCLPQQLRPIPYSSMAIGLPLLHASVVSAASPLPLDELDEHAKTQQLASTESQHHVAAWHYISVATASKNLP